MARLIVTETEGAREFELGEQASIGRHPNNAINLPDPLVSKEHCLIFSNETATT